MVRHHAARLLLGVACAGLAIAVAATTIAWAAVGRTERTARRSLDLTTDAVGSVADTVAVARAMLATVSDALGTVERSLGTVGASLDATQGVLGKVSGFAGGPLPGAIESAAGTLPGLADVGDAVDRALRTLARVPLGITYDPAVPFGDAVRRLGGSLTGLPEQSRALATALDRAADASSGVRADLAALQGDLATANGRLGDARALLDRYAATAHDARDLAVATRADVGSQARAGRLLAVLARLGLAALQAVPLVVASVWWRRPDDSADDGTTAQDDPAGVLVT